jgi:ketosteroid isomerase-like protein
MVRSAEIEALVHAWFAAASAGDPTLVETRVSRTPETLLVGSDPDEVIRGGDEVIAFLRGEVDGAAGTVDFQAADVVAYQNGDLGWANARLTITIPDGGRITPRWTAVFGREDGLWRLVHLHVSFGVSNEQVGWVYPD